MVTACHVRESGEDVLGGIRWLPKVHAASKHTFLSRGPLTHNVVTNTWEQYAQKVSPFPDEHPAQRPHTQKATTSHQPHISPDGRIPLRESSRGKRGPVPPCRCDGTVVSWRVYVWVVFRGCERGKERGLREACGRGV